MNTLYLITLCFVITLLFTLSSAMNSYHSKKIPAMYVFGDSLVDCGNNNHLPSGGPNYLPFGIDFIGRKPTGRATNGKTLVDFVAMHLGLPFAPPFLGLSNHRRNKISTGINYASGGSGILPETNNDTRLTLDKQIKFFHRTVKHNLPKLFNEKEKLEKHMSESLFFVSTGVNDHFSNGTFRGNRKFALFLLNQFSLRIQKLIICYIILINKNGTLTIYVCLVSLSEQFHIYEFSLSKIQSRFHMFALFVSNNITNGKFLSLLILWQRLHRLGARKFFVNNVPPAGCFPSKAVHETPRGKCNEKINKGISFYNRRLPQLLHDLQSKLPGFTFVLADLFGFLLEMRETGINHGILETWKPCCPNTIYGDLQCRPNDVPCPNRNTHLFFDNHPTQIVNQIFASLYFN
uniref:GDSL esterase/lipase At2g03980 family n=1 Tax=Cajanus cajan TaxID=3821 RepID=A0A151QLR3_CAJCA|nr:GDSL esterase/lipase At2g03980 family [Cajanus cajan]